MKKPLLPTFILVGLFYICNMLKQFFPRHGSYNAINGNPRFFLERFDGGFRFWAKDPVNRQPAKLPLDALHPDAPASTPQKVARIVGEQVAPSYRANDPINSDVHFPLELLDAGLGARAENAIHRQSLQLSLDFLDYFSG